MSYNNQHELGLAGLALLRNWLVGGENDASIAIDEIRRLIKKPLTIKKVSKFNIAKGYEIWAENYDTVPNLLINVEEPVVRSILKKFKPGVALDAACGTGRYSDFLYSLGHKVVSVDQSTYMLSQAKNNRNKNIQFIKGNLSSLPVRDASVDLVVCALALTHLAQINDSIIELYRVVRPGGHIVISDIHPWLIVLGGQADFVDKSGNYGFVQNYLHWYSEYFTCFNSLGLKVVQCVEPLIKEKHLRLADGSFELNQKTVSVALKNLPAALVWVLEKP